MHKGDSNTVENERRRSTYEQLGTLTPIVRRYDASGRRYRPELPPSYLEHVRQVIERDIIEGRLAPGQRVAEEELANWIGVSRTPIREAIRLLEERGLIVRRRSRGTNVAPRISPGEAKALYDLRVPLESYLAARAAEHMTMSELEELIELKDGFREVLKEEPRELAVKSLIALDSDFHWTIYHSARTELLSVVASYWGRLQRELFHRVYPGEQSGFAEEHEQIVQALGERSPERAHAAMAKHIRSAWSAISGSYEGESGSFEETGPTFPLGSRSNR